MWVRPTFLSFHHKYIFLVFLGADQNSCRNLVMFWFLNIWMTWQIVGGAKTGWVVVLIREIIKPFGRRDWSGNFIFRYLGQAANASSNNPWVTCWQYSPNQDSAILNDSQPARGWAEDSLGNNLSCCSSSTAWQRLEELYRLETKQEIQRG